MSEAVNTQLATLVDKMVKTMLFEENAREKLAKYNRPQKSDNLVSTRVNPENMGENEIQLKIQGSVHAKDWNEDVILPSFCFKLTDPYGAFGLRTKSLQMGTD